MATVDEFRAIYGGIDPPVGQADAADLGNGGCNVIIKDTGAVIGHWSSWEMASRALNRLQKLGGLFEYRLEESHRWVKGLEGIPTCSRCGVTRQHPGASGTMATLDDGW
jgi:hypothetical protein